MKIRLFGAAIAAALFAAGCQTTGAGADMSVAQFCADPANMDDYVCQMKLELDGQSTELAATSMSLADARAVADSAMTKAEEAAAKAEAARSLANSAMLKASDLDCKTMTIQKTNIGSCEPGYTLMSCTQTRYTYAAGGPSIMREIDDQQCRFHSRVLEMKVRCCRSSGAATASTAVMDANS